MHRTPLFPPALMVLSLLFTLLGAGPAGAAAPHRPAKGHQVRHHHRSPATVSLAQGAAGPCANADLEPSQANTDLVRAAALCLINRVRTQHGIAALSVNATLERIAKPYAQAMVDGNFFAHATPGGQTPMARFLLSGYLPSPLNVAYQVGENLGWGTGSLSTPNEAVNAWVHSPEHLANILNPRYRETGIGVADGVPASLARGQAGATYVEEFGSVRS